MVKGRKAPANFSNDFNIVFMNSKLQMVIVSEGVVRTNQTSKMELFCENC